MMTFKNLVEEFKSNFGDQLRLKAYLLADTRIPWVALYDHLGADGWVGFLPKRSSGTGDVCGVACSGGYTCKK